MHRRWGIFQWGVGTPQAKSSLCLETLPPAPPPWFSCPLPDVAMPGAKPRQGSRCSVSILCGVSSSTHL